MGVPLEIIETLIKHNIQALKKPSKKNGRLPIHLSILHPDYLVVKLLLRNYSDGAFVQDAHGHTPLSYHLCWSNKPSMEVVQMLLTEKNNSVSTCDNYGLGVIATFDRYISRSITEKKHTRKDSTSNV